MQVIQGGPAWATLGALVAVAVALLAVLGLVGVLPFTPVVIFALVLALAVARLT